MNMKIAKWIHKNLGDEWGGTPGPPGVLAELDFGGLDTDGRSMFVARTYPDDGFNLWLGTHDKWHVFYSAPEARRLAWFILWTWWIKGTWFDLKRKIWYYALHLIVEESNKYFDLHRGDHRFHAENDDNLICIDCDATIPKSPS
jgi:hypothetical protein